MKREPAFVLALAAAAAPLSAAEIRDCLNPHAPVALVDHPLAADTHGAIAAQLALALRPRDAHGNVVGWNAGGKVGIVCHGMSNMAQICPKLITNLKELMKRNGTLPPEIAPVNAAFTAQATREWADDTNPAWDSPTLNRTVASEVAKAGLTPAQVLIWIQTHAVKNWSVAPGSMSLANVSDAMANAKRRYSNIGFFAVADLAFTGFSWNVNSKTGALMPGFTAYDGLAYPAGTIRKHPAPSELAKDGALLKFMARTQTGVPAGSRLEFFRMTTNGPGTEGPGMPVLACETWKTDGVHHTTNGPTSGANVMAANWLGRLWAWAPYRSAFPW